MRMKKIIMAALACMLALPMMAQLGEERHNLAIGVGVGMDMTKVDLNPRVKMKSHNGMTFGVTARYMSEKYFKMMCGIQVELNYTQRGWQENIEDGILLWICRILNQIYIPLHPLLLYVS